MNKLIVVLILAVIWAGTCNEEEMQNEDQCKYRGQVVDNTGLDGCGLMIELEDGGALEVVKMPEGKALFAGDKISFDYVERTDMASICMAGKMVEVTCYEVVESSKKQNCKAFVYAWSDSMQTAERSDFKLNNYRTEGTNLFLDISYSGCSIDRDFNLIVSNAQMRSMPPQNTAILSFEAQACEAYFTNTICFDMKELGMETVLLLQVGDSTERVHYKPGN